MSRRAAGILAVFLVAPACVTEQVEPPRPGWELVGGTPEVSIVGQAPPDADETDDDVGVGVDDDLLDLITPATAADLGPDVFADEAPSPFHRLGHNVVRGLDGSWTKIYSLRAGRGQSVVDLLQTYVPGFPSEPGTPSDPEAPPTRVVKWVLHAGFYADEVLPSFGARDGLVDSALKHRDLAAVADVLHVTAPPETLLFIDELLHKVLADLPQIELQVRVVEVNLDDSIDWDAKVIARNLEDRREPFDPETNPPDGNFGSGVPILDDGVESGIGAAFSSLASGKINLAGFLVSLQGVHNDLEVDAVLSLLQTLGAAELINSPTVTVLNGHRARLVTGNRVPVFQASGNVNSPNVTTKFEPTGVELEMIPFVVSEDLIRIDLSVDVSAQTGAVPFVISGTTVSSPIISQRTAGTTVHVYSDQIFSIGGLRSKQQIETITKVPLLGDIPILGWFFKSRVSQEQETEILFFITPVIKRPSETLLDPLDS